MFDHVDLIPLTTESILIFLNYILLISNTLFYYVNILNRVNKTLILIYLNTPVILLRIYVIVAAILWFTYANIIIGLQLKLNKYNPRL